MVAIRKEQPEEITLPIDQVIHGDALETMRGLPDNSVHAIVTDPPYGLGEVKDIAKLLIAWASGEDGSEYNNKKGFMSRDWDVVPSPLIWKEAYRVLCPGGHLLAFAGTRTWDLMSMAIRLAGFEDRDTIAHLAGQPAYGVSALLACQGQGFPKSTDISRAIDAHLGKSAEREVVGFKRHARDGDVSHQVWVTQDTNKNKNTYGDYPGFEKKMLETAPATPESARYAGYGSSLKPAFEPILVFRKPLDGTLAANVLKWQGCGALNIDQCRINPGEYVPGGGNGQAHNGGRFGAHETHGTRPIVQSHNLGRFPSNLLLSHSIWCVKRGTKRVKGNKGFQGWEGQHTINDYGKYEHRSDVNPSEHDGYETVEDWQCSEDCPIRIIGEQSGERKSGYRINPSTARNTRTTYGKYPDEHTFGERGYQDEGSASRYFTNFPPDAPDFVPFKYVSKASRTERNAGCEGLPEVERHTQGRDDVRWIDRKDGKGLVPVNARIQPAANDHPTCKSVSLMSWLAKLVTPEGGVILDPFGGSGTTGVSAVKNGFHFILIEQDAHYCDIARARIAHAMQEARDE